MAVHPCRGTGAREGFYTRCLGTLGKFLELVSSVKRGLEFPLWRDALGMLEAQCGCLTLSSSELASCPPSGLLFLCIGSQRLVDWPGLFWALTRPCESPAGPAPCPSPRGFHRCSRHLAFSLLSGGEPVTFDALQALSQQVWASASGTRVHAPWKRKNDHITGTCFFKMSSCTLRKKIIQVTLIYNTVYFMYTLFYNILFQLLYMLQYVHHQEFIFHPSPYTLTPPLTLLHSPHIFGVGLQVISVNIYGILQEKRSCYM